MTNNISECSENRSKLLARVPASSNPAEVVSLLKAQGAVIVENVLSRDELDLLRSELGPWFERAYHGEGQFFGRGTKRFSAILAKAPSTTHLAIHPLVLEVMEQTLKAEPARCSTIELNLSQAIGIEPGEPPQFLHRDEDLWPFAHDFEIMANALWMLDDFTPQNGATRLIPGSHCWQRDREPQPGEALPAIGPAGSVILWLGGTLHGGGSNQSNAIRHGLVFSYRLGWLAPAEKMLLSIPPDVVREFPQRLQKLIGYQIHRPNLGWVEGRDPIEWLHGQVQDLAVTADNLTEQHELLLADVNSSPDRYQGFLT